MALIQPSSIDQSNGSWPGGLRWDKAGREKWVVGPVCGDALRVDGNGKRPNGAGSCGMVGGLGWVLTFFCPASQLLQN